MNWQIANGSSTAHVIDPARPAWRNPDGSRRLSGPRALCGRYPQRNADDVWFELPVDDPEALTTIRGFPTATVCPDCMDALPAPTVRKDVDCDLCEPTSHDVCLTPLHYRCTAHRYEPRPTVAATTEKG